jgi:hypothetical protein
VSIAERKFKEAGKGLRTGESWAGVEGFVLGTLRRLEKRKKSICQGLQLSHLPSVSS